MNPTGTQISNDTLESSIAHRAYAIWEAEGRPDGRDFDHWLRAETEMAKKSPSRPRTPRRKASQRPRSKKA